MQRSVATILLLALALTAAVVCWVILGGGPPPPVDEPGATPVATSGDGRAPGVGPPGGAEGQGEREGERPRVFVQVRALEEFVAPPAPRVAAVRLDTGAPLPMQVLAGEGAGLDARAHEGLALVAIGIDGGGCVVRQVEVAATGVARAAVGARIVATGRVPAGARVWLGELDASGELREAVADGEGAFELDVPAGTGVPFVVRAVGCASTWQPVTVSGVSRSFSATLQPGCSLDVQLAGAAEGIERARVFVVPTAVVSTGAAQYPFLLQAVLGGFVVGQGGRATVPDLPRGSEIGVVVEHPLAPGVAPKVVALKTAHERTIVPLARSASVVGGSVIDEGGHPLAGVSVWRRPRGQRLGGIAAGRFLPPHLGVPGACGTATDEDGRFTVGDVEDRDAVLSLRAPGRAGRDLSLDQVAARIVLPEWRGDQPEVRLSPPRPGVSWVAETDLAGGVRAEVAADQPWVVSFPHAGRFDVIVTTSLGGEVRGEAKFADLMVAGRVELQAPRGD
jgi:hypothetical protein